MTMRRPEKILKITLATFAKRPLTKFCPFFFEEKLEFEHIKLSGENLMFWNLGPQSMAGKKLGCEFRISKLPITTLKDGPFFKTFFFESQ